MPDMLVNPLKLSPLEPVMLEMNNARKALLPASLWGLREMGYVYGIIGHAGPVEFDEKAVGAIVIPDSNPGIYTDLLK